MELDDTLCYCFHVTKRKIINFIRVHRPQRASQVSQCGGAGTGCGWCVPYLQRYFRELTAAGAVSPDEVTREAYAAGRESHLASGRGKAPDNQHASGRGQAPDDARRASVDDER